MTHRLCSTLVALVAAVALATPASAAIRVSAPTAAGTWEKGNPGFCEQFLTGDYRIDTSYRIVVTDANGRDITSGGTVLVGEPFTISVPLGWNDVLSYQTYGNDRPPAAYGEGGRSWWLTCIRQRGGGRASHRARGAVWKRGANPYSLYTYPSGLIRVLNFGGFAPRAGLNYWVGRVVTAPQLEPPAVSVSASGVSCRRDAAPEVCRDPTDGTYVRQGLIGPTTPPCAPRPQLRLSCVAQSGGARTLRVTVGPTTARVFEQLTVVGGYGLNIYSPTTLFNASIPPATATIALTARDPNTPPNAPSITGPTTGLRNTTYSFTIQSTDPDGDAIRYEIDWDNNGTVDQRIVEGAFIPSGTAKDIQNDWAGPGDKTFAVRAVDENSGVSNWTSHTITLQNQAPATPSLSGPTTGAPNTTYTYTVSSTDPEGDSISYEVTWGDGSATTTTANTTASHAWSTRSDYTITARAIDAYGATSPARTLTTRIGTNAPTITQLSGSCIVGGSGAATVQANDSDGDSVYYLYDIDGGTPTRTPPSGTVASGVPHTFPLSCVSTQPVTLGVTATDTTNRTSARATTTITPTSPCTHCTYDGGDASVTLTATPLLVPLGDTSTLSWSIANATDCTVAGPGFSRTWDTVRTATSSPTPTVTTQTTYTLSCTAINTGTTVSDTATVRIVPDWQEF